MSAPPKDIPPSELFRKLMVPLPSEVIDFPRRDANGDWVGKVRIQVLPQDQHDRARELADAALEKRGISLEKRSAQTIREVAGDAVAKELIAMACVTAEPATHDENGHPIYGRIFRDARDVGKLPAHEVAVLFNACLLVQHKYGPREGDPDTDLWVKRLMEGGSAFPLLSLGLPDVVDLASSFAERVYSISRILESQWSTLPESCQSSLSRFNIGIGYWSSPLDDYDPTSTGKSPDLEIEDAIALEKKLRAAEDIRGALNDE